LCAGLGPVAPLPPVLDPKVLQVHVLGFGVEDALFPFRSARFGEVQFDEYTAATAPGAPSPAVRVNRSKRTGALVSLTDAAMLEIPAPNPSDPWAEGVVKARSAIVIGVVVPAIRRAQLETGPVTVVLAPVHVQVVQSHPP